MHNIYYVIYMMNCNQNNNSYNKIMLTYFVGVTCLALYLIFHLATFFLSMFSVANLLLSHM